MTTPQNLSTTSLQASSPLSDDALPFSRSTAVHSPMLFHPSVLQAAGIGTSSSPFSVRDGTSPSFSFSALDAIQTLNNSALRIDRVLRGNYDTRVILSVVRWCFILSGSSPSRESVLARSIAAVLAANHWTLDWHRAVLNTANMKSFSESDARGPKFLVVLKRGPIVASDIEVYSFVGPATVEHSSMRRGLTHAAWSAYLQFISATGVTPPTVPYTSSLALPKIKQEKVSPVPDDEETEMEEAVDLPVPPPVPEALRRVIVVPAFPAALTPEQHIDNNMPDLAVAVGPEIGPIPLAPLKMTRTRLIQMLEARHATRRSMLDALRTMRLNAVRVCPVGEYVKVGPNVFQIAPDDAPLYPGPTPADVLAKDNAFVQRVSLALKRKISEHDYACARYFTWRSTHPTTPRTEYVPGPVNLGMLGSGNSKGDGPLYDQSVFYSACFLVGFVGAFVWRMRQLRIQRERDAEALLVLRKQLSYFFTSFGQEHKDIQDAQSHTSAPRRSRKPAPIDEFSVFVREHEYHNPGRVWFGAPNGPLEKNDQVVHARTTSELTLASAALKSCKKNQPEVKAHRAQKTVDKHRTRSLQKSRDTKNGPGPIDYQVAQGFFSWFRPAPLAGNSEAIKSPTANAGVFTPGSEAALPGLVGASLDKLFGLEAIFQKYVAKGKEVAKEELTSLDSLLATIKSDLGVIGFQLLLTTLLLKLVYDLTHSWSNKRAAIGGLILTYFAWYYRGSIQVHCLSACEKFFAARPEGPTETPQTAQGAIDSLSHLVAVCMAKLSIGEAATGKHWSVVATVISNYERVRKGSVDILQHIVTMLVACYNWLARCFGVTEIEALETGIQALDEWRLEAAAFTRAFNSRTLPVDPLSRSRLEALIHTGSALAGTFTRAEEATKVRDVLNVYLPKMKSEMMDYFSSLSTAQCGPRQEPVVVLLSGASGVGKSCCLYALNMMMLQHMFKDDPNNLKLLLSHPQLFIWNYQPELGYDDSLQRQVCYNIDEIFQLKDDFNPESEAMRMVRLGNMFPSFAHMAQAPKKGEVMHQPMSIFCSSNATRIPPLNTVHCREAVLRRFEISVIVYPAKEYCTETTKDAANVEDRRLNPALAKSAFDLDIYRFMDNREIAMREGGTQIRREFTELKFHEFCDMLYKAYDQKKEKHVGYIRNFMLPAQAMIEARLAEIAKVVIPPLQVAPKAKGFWEGCMDKVRVELEKAQGRHPPTSVPSGPTKGKEHAQEAQGSGDPADAVDVVFAPMPKKPKFHETFFHKFSMPFRSSSKSEDPEAVRSRADAALTKLLGPLPHVEGILTQNEERDLKQAISSAMPTWSRASIDLVARELMPNYIEALREGPESVKSLLQKIAFGSRELDLIFRDTPATYEVLGDTEWLSIKSNLTARLESFRTVHSGTLERLGQIAVVGASVSALVAAFYGAYKLYSYFATETPAEAQSISKKERDTIAHRKRPGKQIAQGDTTAIDTATLLYDRCLFGLWTNEDDLRPVSFLLFVEGNVALINIHTVRNLEQQLKTEDPSQPGFNLLMPGDCLYMSPAGHPERKVEVPVSDLLDFTPVGKGGDIGLVSVSSKKNPAPTVSDKFVPAAKLPRSDAVRMLLVRSMNGKERRDLESSAHYRTNRAITSEAGDYVIPGALLYNIDTHKGDCGSPTVMVDSGSGKHKILGAHVSGDPRGGSGQCQVISLEDLNAALTEHRKRLGNWVVDASPAPLIDEKPHAPNAAFIPRRTIRPIHSASRTQISPSPLQEPGVRYFDPVTKPAHLKPFPGPDGPIDPYELAVSVYTRVPPPDSAFDVFRLAARYEAESVLKAFSFIPATSVRQFIPYRKAVAGDPSKPNWDGIDRTTSPGFEYQQSCPPGWAGKAYWLGKGDSYEFDGPGPRQLLADVVLTLRAASQGIRLEHAHTDFLKDERRKIAKVDAGATRFVSAAPLHKLVADRMAFGDFTQKYMTSRIENGSSLGINVFSAEWNRLAQRVRYTGSKHIGGDLSTCDTTLFPTPIDMIRQEVIESYFATESTRLLKPTDLPFDDVDIGSLPSTPFLLKHVEISDYLRTLLDVEVFEYDWPKIREVLMLDVSNSLHGRADTLYEWFSAHPSGHFLTAILTTLYVGVAIRTAFATACPEGIYHGLKAFGPCAFKIGNGDDHLVSLNDWAATWFNPAVMKRELAKIGMIYTNADKTEPTEEFTPFLELTFLKRKFRWEPTQHEFVCPLDLNVVLEMPLWTREKARGEAPWKLAFATAINELALHDLKVWEEWAPRMLSSFQTATGVAHPVRDRAQAMMAARSGDLFA